MNAFKIPETSVMANARPSAICKDLTPRKSGVVLNDHRTNTIKQVDAIIRGSQFERIEKTRRAFQRAAVK